MDKYIVLERTLRDETIVNCFGVFKKHSNAVNRVKDIGEAPQNTFYCIEKVDPLGSYANEICEDE